ncbi:hypothetical protein [Lysinibacillus sp. LZ02]|uniref:hypothetical protein n=1 Tax=Lysinibacillus sp. LZ02 TaxID=3420668 RepID=UPI003D36AFF8
MPIISKIRFSNVVYEGGNKRYTDEIFHFHGENSAIVLENGGGKTVFIQAALQAILPHTSLANRKIKETLVFDDGPAHIAIEWIKNDRPRIYALTAITIFPHQNGIDSYRYVYEYGPNDAHRIENLPFTHKTTNNQKRIASHAEMKEYYSMMSQQSMSAQTFATISSYTEYIEKNFQIISDEWKSINTINSAEGDVEEFFAACPTEKALYEKLLIPTVEQSIASFEKNKFVDIFEKHRDKFQLFKQLTAQLKEYEAIQKRLARYVDVVASLHEKQLDYEAVKQLAKKLDAQLKNLIAQNEEKSGQLNDRQQQLEQQLQHLNFKEKSYEIAVIQEKLIGLTEREQQLARQKQSVQTNIDDNALYLANLKYTNEQHLLIQSEQLVQLYEGELRKIDEQLSNTDLLQQLDDVKAAIRGNQLSEQQRFDKQVQAAQLTVRQSEKLYQEHLDRTAELKRVVTEIDNELIRLQERISMSEEQSEAMAKYLFDDDVQKQQPLAELRQQWTQQEQQLDDLNVRFQNEQSELTDKKEQYAERVTALSNVLLQLKEKESTIREKLNVIAQHEQKILQQLMTYLSKITVETNLYSKEASITQQLTQMLEKKERLYADKLHEERLALRHVDDYGEQQTFFADPYIAKQLPSWNQQFSYLETAIEYAMNDETIKLNQALLAITLITTDDEKEALEQKVLRVAEYLTYPIQVWSLSQAIAISKGEIEPPNALLEPALWQQLSDSEAFTNWQQQAQQHATKIEQERKRLEAERANVAQLLQQLQQFYTQYPFAHFQQLEKGLKELQVQTYETNKQRNDAQGFVKQADETLQQIRLKIDHNKEQHNYYHDKLKQVLEYEKVVKAIQQLQQQMNLENDNYNLKTVELNQLQQQCNEAAEQFEEAKDALASINSNYQILQAKRHLYEEVKDAVPVFTETDYDVLAQQYYNLDNQIKGFASDRQSKEQLIVQQKQQSTRCQQQMEQLLAEYSEIDKQLPLPVNIGELLISLPKSIKGLESDFALVSNQYTEASTEKAKVEGALELKMNEIEAPFKFTDPLATVLYQLQQENKRLQLQQNQLTQSKNTVSKQRQQLQETAQKMLVSDAKHSFLAPHITLATLTIEEENDFMYRQDDFIQSCMKQLDDVASQVNRQREMTNNEKEAFLQFCQQEVSEVRLRNTIIDGIKSKQTYEDIVQHQHNMDKTIHMSRQYTEEDIKKHDENLVHFIQHIHVHLRKVVDELKLIPRKTKVQVDGEDVLIYRFTIPEWSEEEGHAQIRARLDWIMEQLEQIEKRTPDEQESQQKVRKQLEEWLSTVQLLRYITQNKEWRIACRKVMNDNRIAKGYETWSRSNAWSGGEKWSKNMALFLGLLNYVAEKRQFISSKQKSRTVILDNPFGKASSDHVLSPVFFIAQQLGFQIIALTAHVEGKFLHDYFPVVYSCRLRSAVGVDKLIVETKKTVHYALFQDHDEAAGEAIKSEQLQLFMEN